MSTELHTTTEAVRGRRRVAPKIEETSDVLRFRGLAVAAVATGIFGIAATIAIWGIDGVRSPGPLSKPHAVAGLGCASCHQEEPATSACVGCHGAHASTRPAHRDLAASGELRCSTCHRVHEDDSGVLLRVDAPPIRYGTHGERALEEAQLAFRPEKDTAVPIVSAEVCAGCHDPSSPTDPVRVCLVDGHEALGLLRPTVCFDEHRSVGAIAPADGVALDRRGTNRDAAWEAARQVARDAPTSPASIAGARAPLGWVGAGAGVAFLVALVARLRKRRRSEPAPEPEMLHAAEVVRLPAIDTSTCIGCYACVDACPYDVLEVKRYVAVVTRPDDCCGLTLCEQRCPNGSLVVTEGERVEDRPEVKESLEASAVPGLFVAGDLTGLPLIKNAINQGAHAVSAIADSRPVGGEGLDLVVVGAGPAGISAALAAKGKGLRFVVLEQGSVAESIRSFPRGKLVFDQPLNVPLVGDLWLEEASKEELLGKWLRIVRKEKLPVRQGCRVTAVKKPERDGGMFEVRYVGEAGVESTERARRVLLAVGRRGSPRKLPVEIPDGVADRVHYSLADARSFTGQRVIVVGLGDVAMETAIALARQFGTEVTVVHRGAGFTRGKSRNVEETERMVAAGRVRLELEATVVAFEDARVVIEGPRGRRGLPFDALFVMIGSIPSRALLAAIGVRKK